MTWPPPGRITGCDICDDHDVEDPRTLYYAGRDLHRAWHEMYRPAETFLRARLYEPLARALDPRATDATHQRHPLRNRHDHR